MSHQQKSGKIKLPEGKNVAVSLTYDCDALSLWIGSVGRTTPVSLSRGEYGAVVGIPRILEMLKKYDIITTFFIPGHTADTYPNICRAILDAGHEIGWHGYAHHSNSTMSYEEEDRTMQMGLDALARIGAHPVGYRSPSCDYSPNTMTLLEKYGFKYSSNLMGNDMYPYYSRPVTGHLEQGNTFGSPLSVLELPLAWYTDDIIFIEYVNKFPYMPPTYLRPAKEHYERCITAYDYTRRFPGCELILVNHPQASGHPEFIINMERMIEHMQDNGAWFTTCESIADNFVPDSEKN
jgi:peptidoglycan/xylan/chitin deacetylase (PgdA/CDA1 family)